MGTEANPFPEQYTATIKLYGHQKSRELPIYGTKVLGLREGTLDLHGYPTPVTWTLLAATASAGATQVTLTTPVNWKVGHLGQSHHTHELGYFPTPVRWEVGPSELPTVTFWPYFDTATLKNVRKYGLLKKNTAANLPKITAVKSSVDLSSLQLFCQFLHTGRSLPCYWC